MPGYGLKLSGVHKIFSSPGAVDVHALRGIDLEISPGEFVVVVGRNGSGKSTLLNVIAGDLSVEHGRLALLGGAREMNWTSVPPWKRAHLIARVFQDPGRGTVSDLSVAENVALAMLTRPVPSLIRSALRPLVRDQLHSRLERVGLGGRLHANSADLSHGQLDEACRGLARVSSPAQGT